LQKKKRSGQRIIVFIFGGWLARDKGGGLAGRHTSEGKGAKAVAGELLSTGYLGTRRREAGKGAKSWGGNKTTLTFAGWGGF